MKDRILHIWLGTSVKQKKAAACMVVAFILLSWFFTWDKVPTSNLPLVSTEVVKCQTIPQKIKIASTLIPQAEVLIRNRIDSQIREVHFKEGQLVEEGDMLFTLDDDLLQSQLKQEEANLEKNEALVIQSEKELKRNEILLKKGAATQSVVDTLVATMKGNKANQEGSEAQIELLKLQIGYAQIKSPVKGLAGFVKLQPGNVVRQSETAPLVSVVSIDPISVIFDIPERYMSQVLSKGLETIKVSLIDVNNKPLKNLSKPVAIDQGVNSKSGVFSLKVLVENSALSLRPGMSVNGILEIGSYNDAIVIPSTAVLSGQNGSYVFVFDDKQKTVKRRTVKVRDSFDGIAIIENGLKSGEIVVTEGQIHLKDGVVVRKRPSETL